MQGIFQCLSKQWTNGNRARLARANPVPLAYAETYVGLQTGVVDGDGANVIYWDYEYFRDTLDYYNRTKQQFVTGILSMNLEAFEALTPEQQEVVQNAAVTVMEEHFEAAQELDQHYVEKAIEAGMEYIEPSDEECRALARTVRERVWPMVERRIGSEIVDTIWANATPL